MAIVVALLTACGGGVDEPEAPEPGPLELSSTSHACTPGEQTDVMVVTIKPVRNTGEIPLTIDAVALVGADNADLVEAMIGDRPAVDATIVERGKPGAAQELHLDVRMAEPGRPLSIDAVTVDYHNVDGRYRASTSAPLTVTCPRR